MLPSWCKYNNPYNNPQNFPQVFPVLDLAAPRCGQALNERISSSNVGLVEEEPLASCEQFSAAKMFTWGNSKEINNQYVLMNVIEGEILIVPFNSEATAENTKRFKFPNNEIPKKTLSTKFIDILNGFQFSGKNPELRNSILIYQHIEIENQGLLQIIQWEKDSEPKILSKKVVDDGRRVLGLKLLELGGGIYALSMQQERQQTTKYELFFHRIPLHMPKNNEDTSFSWSINDQTSDLKFRIFDQFSVFKDVYSTTAEKKRKLVMLFNQRIIKILEISEKFPGLVVEMAVEQDFSTFFMIQNNKQRVLEAEVVSENLLRFDMERSTCNKLISDPSQTLHLSFLLVDEESNSRSFTVQALPEFSRTNFGVLDPKNPVGRTKYCRNGFFNENTQQCEQAFTKTLEIENNNAQNNDDREEWIIQSRYIHPPENYDYSDPRNFLAFCMYAAQTKQEFWKCATSLLNIKCEKDKIDFFASKNWIPFLFSQVFITKRNDPSMSVQTLGIIPFYKGFNISGASKDSFFKKTEDNEYLNENVFFLEKFNQIPFLGLLNAVEISPNGQHLMAILSRKNWEMRSLLKWSEVCSLVYQHESEKTKNDISSSSLEGSKKKGLNKRENLKTKQKFLSTGEIVSEMMKLRGRHAKEATRTIERIGEDKEDNENDEDIRRFMLEEKYAKICYDYSNGKTPIFKTNFTSDGYIPVADSNSTHPPNLFLQYSSNCVGVLCSNLEATTYDSIPNGKYTRAPNIISNCPRGYFCSSASGGQKVKCPSGFICPDEGMTTPIPCDENVYWNTTCFQQGLTKPEICPDGAICEKSFNIPIPIQDGYFIKKFESRRDSFIFSSVYDAKKSNFTCKKGDFCPIGRFVDNSDNYLNNLLCPSGSFCQTPAVLFPKACNCSFEFCSYCEAGSTSPTPCPAGYFCNEPTHKEECIPTMWCPEGTFQASPCPPGSYCPTPAEKIICPFGHFCVVGSTYPKSCPFLSWCPSGSSKTKIDVLGFASTFVVVVGLVLFSLVVSIAQRCYFLQFVKKRFQKLKEREALKQQQKNFGEEYSKLMEEIISQEDTTSMASILSSDAPKSTRKSIFGLTYGSVNAKDSERTSNSRRKNECPMDISFKNLTLTLPSGKKVLKSVSGTIKHGRLFCVMGASGSGKSSFLTALSGRAYYGHTTGDIFINGKHESSRILSKLQNLIGFVPQQDIMLPPFTVRETISFAARTKLNMFNSLFKASEMINETIIRLGLDNVQNSIVGDEEKRGISGGEKKRVNIGMELVSSPSILFLDEPTSGLDSSSAMTICKHLREIAESGLSVISVIHQPRKEIFELFDDVLLLGWGETIFFGDRRLIVPYFKALGFAPKKGTNPADFILDICNNFYERKDDPGFSPEKDLPRLWKQHENLFNYRFLEDELKEKADTQVLSDKNFENSEEKNDNSNAVGKTVFEDGSVTVDIYKKSLLPNGNNPPEVKRQEYENLKDDNADDDNTDKDYEDISSADELAQDQPDNKKIVDNDEGLSKLQKKIQKLELSNNYVPPAPFNLTLASWKRTPSLTIQFIECIKRPCVQMAREVVGALLLDFLLVWICGFFIAILFSSDQMYIGSLPKHIWKKCGPLEEMCKQPQKDSIVFSASTTSLSLSLAGVMSSLRTFGNERVVFSRETQGSLGSIPYFLGKNIAQLPIILLGPFIFLSCFYTLLNPRGPILEYYLITFTLYFTAYGLGYLVSLLFDAKSVKLAGVIFTLIFYMFSGIAPTLPRFEKMSIFVRYLPNLSFLRWNFEPLYLIELKTYERIYDLSASLEHTGFEFSRYWHGILFTFLYGFVFRLAAFVILLSNNPNSVVSTLKTLVVNWLGRCYFTLHHIGVSGFYSIIKRIVLFVKSKISRIE